MESEGNIENLDNFDKRILKKFLNILPKKVKIYYYLKDDDIKKIIFYLGKKQQNLTKKDMDTSLIYGSITGYIRSPEDDESRDCNITGLSTNSQFTGMGIGGFLILLYTHYVKGLGLSTIELDDDSDFARTENSIYVKLGFEYEDQSEGANEPEMIGDLKKITEHWSAFKKKYTERGFFK